MKYILTIILASVAALFPFKSLPSEAVGFSKTTCINYVMMDTHYLSFPFVNETDSAHTLDPTGQKFRAIYGWNAELQAWYGCTYSLFGIWMYSNRFKIIAGQSYIIGGLQCDFDFIRSGDYSVLPQYNLITSEYGTADMNLIMVPLEKFNLRKAGAGVGSDIGLCDRVVKWDPTVQASRVTTYNGLGWLYDFDVQLADPIFVNMTGNTTWPALDSNKFVPVKNMDFSDVNLPKTVTHAIVSSSKTPYDFSDSDDEAKDLQPKDSFITFKAWIEGREDDVLTDQSFGCGFEQIAGIYSSIYINMGNFKNKWSDGEVVTFEVTDQSVKGNWLSGKGKVKISKSSDPVMRGYEPAIKDSGDPIVLDTPTGDEETALPYQTALFQNYPNPFNPTTMINFSLESESDVRLSVYNYAGQITNILINGNMEKGHHKVQFNAEKLSSGVYFYRLEACGKKFIRKMLIVR